MNNVVPFGRSDEMPGTLVGCLLKAEQEEIAGLNQYIAHLQGGMDRAQANLHKFILRTLDRMGTDFDPKEDVLFFQPITGEVWRTTWMEVREWEKRP